jgi:hypothetical protein
MPHISSAFNEPTAACLTSVWSSHYHVMPCKIWTYPPRWRSWWSGRQRIFVYLLVARRAQVTRGSSAMRQTVGAEAQVTRGGLGAIPSRGGTWWPRALSPAVRTHDGLGAVLSREAEAVVLTWSLYVRYPVLRVPTFCVDMATTSTSGPKVRAPRTRRGHWARRHKNRRKKLFAVQL